jgi:hypothetical protein
MKNNILAEGTFSLESDLMSLNIIDFNRLNGYWSDPGAAMRTLFSHLRDGFALYAIYDVPNFDSAPERSDFPNWTHVGNHVQLGRRFWNWFRFHFPDYVLNLGDSPDFQAHKIDSSGHHWIWGDFGQVSASAFALSQKQMAPGDMWISVLDDGPRHVVITYHVDCRIKFDFKHID